VYDAVLNAANVSQSTASLVDDARQDVIAMQDLFHKLTQQGEETAIMDRFAQFNRLKSNFNMVLIDKDAETYEKKETTFTALPELITKYLNIAAAAADIPATRLLGESAPGLNATGESSLKNYYDMVASIQRREFNAQLEKLDQVMVRSALGFYPEDWGFEWNPLWQMTEVEKAQVTLSNAQRDQIYDLMGAIPTSVVTAELKENGVYDGLSNELVEAMQQLDLNSASNDDTE
jgi:phage-related protein (TIGR01555 family)